MIKDIIIIGASGFGREVLQLIKDINREKPTWNILGFIDDNPHALDDYECDYQVLGTIQDWKPSNHEVYAMAIANPQIKEKIVASLLTRGAEFATLIHPTAQIGNYVALGKGLVIYPKALITCNAKIGDFVSLLCSNIGHDADIGAYTTICSSCDVNGHVQLGKRVFLGSHVTIIPGRTIHDDALLTAGSVVMTNVKAGVRMMGNPARAFSIGK